MPSGEQQQWAAGRYEGHPATIYMREDLIVGAVNMFFADRVFGSTRREMFGAGLDQSDDDGRRQRDEERERLRRKVVDTTRKQDNVLRQAEDADPFAQGLHNRYNELEAERQAVLLAIAELESKEAAQPERPSLAAVDLLDALPKVRVNQHQAP